MTYFASNQHKHIDQIIKKIILSFRLIVELAYVRGFEEDLGSAEAAVYTLVHEDSSTESTHKSSIEVELYKSLLLDST